MGQKPSRLGEPTSPSPRPDDGESTVETTDETTVESRRWTMDESDEATDGRDDGDESFRRRPSIVSIVSSSPTTTSRSESDAGPRRRDVPTETRGHESYGTEAPK
eukprot:9362613-Pyramimonas_sp.AAC.1